MENKKEKLKQLIKRNEELKSKIFIDYKTTEELNNYRNNNSTIFQEYNDNQKQIEKLEWDLMTPEERKKEEEIIEKMKLKREGKL